MSNTRIVIPPTRHPADRLPAGPARAALLQLAHRGIALMASRPGRGERLLHRLCSGLATAIGELSGLEDRLYATQRALDVARQRIDQQVAEIDELQHENARLQFGPEATRRVDGGVRGLVESGELPKLRPTSARGVVTP